MFSVACSQTKATATKHIVRVMTPDETRKARIATKWNSILKEVDFLPSRLAYFLLLFLRCSFCATPSTVNLYIHEYI